MERLTAREENDAAGESGRRWSILYTLLILLLIAAVVPLVSTYWILIQMNRQTLRTIQKERQLVIADFLSARISSHVEEALDRLAVVAGEVERAPAFHLAETLSPALQTEARGILERALDEDREKSLLYLALVHRESLGGVTASPSVDPNLVQERCGEQLEQAFAEAEKGVAGEAGEEQPVIGDPFVFRELGRPAVVVARTVLRRRPMEAVLLALVDLEPLRQAVVEMSVERSTVFLVNRQGRVFAHPDREAFLEGRDLSRLPIVQDHLLPSGRSFTSAKDFTVVVDGRPVEMLGTSRWVPGLDGLMVIQISSADAYYPVSRMVRRSMYWAVVWILVAVVLGGLLARRISLPVQQLAGASRAFARGDFSARVRQRSGDEIGQLARTFNFMAVSLESHISRLRTALTKYNQLFIGSLRMIAEAIDEKDPYTRGHAERVTAYSLAVGRQLGLAEEELERLRIAGLLHDVGKIGIDDIVLKKQGVLTDREYDLMKSHPVRGSGIMSPIQEMAGSIPAVLHHHEYIDGSGYPAGLVGEQIPLLARIIGVADTFDAMTTDRCYQPRMTVFETMERICSFVGLRYDARVVEALQAAIDRGEIAVAGDPSSETGAGDA